MKFCWASRTWGPNRYWEPITSDQLLDTRTA